MKKFLAISFASGVLFLSTNIFASNQNEAINSSGRIVSINEENISQRLSTTSLSLGSSWKKVYSDGNWFDAVATIKNDSGNLGSIDIKIEAEDKAGTTVTLESTTGVSPGNSYVSGTISALSYKQYTVYAKTSTPGTYSITYWDNSPKNANELLNSLDEQ